MKTIVALILVAMCTGCAAPVEQSKEEIAWREKILLERAERAATCLPRTGCALQNETPEQFEQRKMLEEAMVKDEQVKSAQKDKDMAVCRYEATKATASSQTGYSLYSSIFNDTTNTFKQAELITLCMKSKGWVG